MRNIECVSTVSSVGNLGKLTNNSNNNNNNKLGEKVGWYVKEGITKKKILFLFYFFPFYINLFVCLFLFHKAKAAVVYASGNYFTAKIRGNITLACRVDGNPLPWVEWYRNKKKLRSRPGKRVIIKQKK